MMWKLFFSALYEVKTIPFYIKWALHYYNLSNTSVIYATIKTRSIGDVMLETKL